MKFQSTRGKAPVVSGLQALINGLAPDGGLYVPQAFPKIDFDWDQLAKADYFQIGQLVLSTFFDEFSQAELADFLHEAYAQFDRPEIVKVHALDDKRQLLELFHGPTLAFKDMALSLLPYLLTAAVKKTGQKDALVILTATSGDTGGAALQGFSDVDQTQIVVYYPSVGVSALQRQQMTTTPGQNAHVVAVEGNFDDAQRVVKKLLADPDLAKQMQTAGLRFSSANSINIGRLVAQVIYYIYAYAQLLKSGRLKPGEKLDVTVPTGNFGDILAAYWAKKLGLPLGKLTVASNANHVLTDFFASGIYNAKRDFQVTTSPAMDILLSSNLERLLFDVAGAEKTRHWMTDLAEKQTFTVDDKTLDLLQQSFNAAFADADQTSQTIKETFRDHDYLLDPHTAVAVHANQQFTTQRQQLIVSTASPFKFAEIVLSALGQKPADDPAANLKQVAQIAKLPVPAAIADLFTKKVRFHEQLTIDQLGEDLKASLGL